MNLRINSEIALNVVVCLKAYIMEKIFGTWFQKRGHNLIFFTLEAKVHPSVERAFKRQGSGKKTYVTFITWDFYPILLLF